jgi:flagellar hook-length control protein FliK
MNSSLNIATTSTPGNDTTASATIKSAHEGPNNADMADSAGSAGSFHDSIKKAYDESKNTRETDDTQKTDEEASGNELPVTDDSTEIAAADDRPILPGGLHLSGQLADGKTPADSDLNKQLSSSVETDSDNEIEDELALLSASTPLASTATTDTKAGGDSKLSEISSQLRQLLNTDAETGTKNSQNTLNRVAAGSTDNADNTVDNSLTQQSENLIAKTDLTALNAEKAGLLHNTPAQQANANIQSSLLLQTAGAHSESAGDTLAMISNTATGTPSTSTQAALPQPAITEAFGRPAWSQSMGKQILLMVNQNISTAEIRLNPAHLGPIEVLIDMSDEQVSVSMSSRHAMVRDAMEQALPKLREMLEQNGFSLADADISQHSFAEQREQNTENNNKVFAAGNAEQAATAEVNGQMMKQATMSTSMVDYYI